MGEGGDGGVGRENDGGDFGGIVGEGLDGQ
jgi:hypothetical protein